MFGVYSGSYWFSVQDEPMQTLPHHTWVIEWSFSHVKHSFGACTYVHTETHTQTTSCTYTLTLLNTLKKGFFTLRPRQFYYCDVDDALLHPLPLLFIIVINYCFSFTD